MGPTAAAAAGYGSRRSAKEAEAEEGEIDEWSRGLEMWKHWLGLPSQYYENRGGGASLVAVRPAVGPAVGPAVDPAVGSDARASRGGGGGRSDVGNTSVGSACSIAARGDAFPVAAAASLASPAADAASPTSPTTAATQKKIFSKEEIAEAVKTLRAAAARRYPDDPQAALRVVGAVQVLESSCDPSLESTQFHQPLNPSRT
jgi:hypothetical protein